MNLLQILRIFAIIFFFGIALPLTSYHGYKYYQNRNLTVYTKRYSSITVLEIILCLIKFFIDGLLFIAFFIDPWGYITWMLSSIDDLLIITIIICIYKLQSDEMS